MNGEEQVAQATVLVDGGPMALEPWLDFQGPVREKHPLELTVVNPADNAQEVGRCTTLSESSLGALLSQVEPAQRKLQLMNRTQRAEVLKTLSAKLAHHRYTLARLIVAEAGKPLKLAEAEVDRAIALCQDYGAILPYWPVATQYEMEGREATVKRFSAGPVLAITPFNFPLNLVVHKVAPAIATGNAIVVKPAPRTPLTALFLGRLIQELDYPGVAVVPCDDDVAEALACSEVFQQLSFTGSAKVGWMLKSKTKAPHVTLELGGNGACLVHDLVEPMEDVARRCAQGAFWYAGQVCISLQRLLIRSPLYDEFTRHLMREVRALKVGDPMDARTDVGPMITLEDVHRTRRIIKDAIGAGANVMYGGNTYNTFTLNPTVMNRTQPEMAINRDEVFAPLLTVEAYDDLDVALDRVNDSAYGLQAGVFTGNRNVMDRAFHQLNVGGVMINDVPTFRIDGLPYGGVKESGLGREGILAALDGMTVPKTMIIRRLPETM